jgi:hypothetical protein
MISDISLNNCYRTLQVQLPLFAHALSVYARTACQDLWAFGQALLEPGFNACISLRTRLTLKICFVKFLKSPVPRENRGSISWSLAISVSPQIFPLQIRRTLEGYTKTEVPQLKAQALSQTRLESRKPQS